MTDQPFSDDPEVPDANQLREQIAQARLAIRRHAAWLLGEGRTFDETDQDGAADTAG